MSETRTHIDQLGRKTEIVTRPQRIVSLVPSQTELLFELGLDERVVGITKFCVHPQEWFRTKPRIGGTKQLNFDAISELNPDLIIANKEENNQEDIKRLEKEFPVWVSDVNDLSSALKMIRLIGEITCADSSVIAKELELEFERLNPPSTKQKTLYLIWKNPYMAAGSHTFIHDMLLRCGLQNAITETRYPALDEDEIRKLNPDLILLSSEPFPFKEKHIEDLKKLLPSAEIRLVDGEMFSWYGSRLKFAPSHFHSVIESLDN